MRVKFKHHRMEMVLGKTPFTADIQFKQYIAYYLRERGAFVSYCLIKVTSKLIKERLTKKELEFVLVEFLYVSQAAACDGNNYQISGDGEGTNSPRGVLPI